MTISRPPVASVDPRRAQRGHGGVVVADACHHPRAGCGGELDGGRADPAGGAVHQQPVAEPEPALGEQRVVGGRHHLREAAGLRPVELLGDGHGDPLVHHRQLRLAAAADQRHHPVVRAEAEHPLADRRDLAGRPGW
jgi:hypothetical protein